MASGLNGGQNSSVEKFGLKLMSMGYMIEPDQTVVGAVNAVVQCAVCKRCRVGRPNYLISICRRAAATSVSLAQNSGVTEASWLTFF